MFQYMNPKPFLLFLGASWINNTMRWGRGHNCYAMPELIQSLLGMSIFIKHRREISGNSSISNLRNLNIYLKRTGYFSYDDKTQSLATTFRGSQLELLRLQGECIKIF